MTLDSAGLDALIADVEGASNESFRRDWLLLRLRYARSLAAAAPPTGENPDGPMTEALWKYAQNEWGWGADDYEACRDAITAVVAAGRAAATPSDDDVALVDRTASRLRDIMGVDDLDGVRIEWDAVVGALMAPPAGRAAATPDPPDDDKRVRVTCFDPVTGDAETQPLDPDNYILTLGERCEITACQVYANGTVQLTIKSPGGK